MRRFGADSLILSEVTLLRGLPCQGKVLQPVATFDFGPAQHHEVGQNQRRTGSPISRAKSSSAV